MKPRSPDDHIETNIDASVDAALGKARMQLDQGGPALPALLSAKPLRQRRCDEEERRERYEDAADANLPS